MFRSQQVIHGWMDGWMDGSLETRFMVIIAEFSFITSSFFCEFGPGPVPVTGDTIRSVECNQHTHPSEQALTGKNRKSFSNICFFYSVDCNCQTRTCSHVRLSNMKRLVLSKARRGFTCCQQLLTTPFDQKPIPSFFYVIHLLCWSV